MTSLLDALLQVAGLAVLTLGGLAIRHLADKLRLSADSDVRAYLQQGLDIAVQYGLSEARRRVLAGDFAREAERNVAVEIARSYAQNRFPDALAHFSADAAGLDQMIRARMPKPPALGGG